MEINKVLKLVGKWKKWCSALHVHLEEGWADASPRQKLPPLWKSQCFAPEDGKEVGLWLLLLQCQQWNKLAGDFPERHCCR